MQGEREDERGWGGEREDVGGEGGGGGGEGSAGGGGHGDDAPRGGAAAAWAHPGRLLVPGGARPSQTRRGIQGLLASDALPFDLELRFWRRAPFIG